MLRDYLHILHEYYSLSFATYQSDYIWHVFEVSQTKINTTHSLSYVTTGTRRNGKNIRR